MQVVFQVIVGEHLKEVVPDKLLVGPFEEQLDGLLQVLALGHRVCGHTLQATPVQPPPCRLVPTHITVL